MQSSACKILNKLFLFKLRDRRSVGMYVCRPCTVSELAKGLNCCNARKFTFAGELLSIVLINVIAFINAFPRPADSELLLKSDIFPNRMVFTCFLIKGDAVYIT